MARVDGERAALLVATDLDAALLAGSKWWGFSPTRPPGATIMAATGSEPAILDEPGSPHRVVATAADDMSASLLVTGSRALSGVSALRSVSERIAHAAPYSVLVVRPAPAA
jgi:hypothetical protein